jgi:hypothetical protein
VSHAERITRILSKLEEVRARGVDTFGAKSHRFALAPPLAEEQAAAFERAHGVTLPADYRAFVTRAGGAGAGPFHGLMPIDRWDEARSGDVPGDDGWLARPCLFSPDDLATGRAYEAIVGDADEPFQGAIAICEQGCSYLALLVVSGPHAGRVLYVNLDGGAPFFPESPDFLAWYERWLDELRWGHRHFWFGMDMPGDEATLAAVAADATAPRRRDALAAMYRLPGLSAATRAAVIARATSDAPDVRAVALAVLGRQKVLEAEPLVRAALTDEAPAIRLEAHRALRALDAPWHDAARAALADPAPAVVADALRELGRAHASDAEAAIPLLDRVGEGAAEIVQWAIVALQEPSPRAAAALLARERRGVAPSGMNALLAQVRAGVTTPAQEEELVALVRARIAGASGPRGVLFGGLASLAARSAAALDALIEATRHEDPFLRYEAGTALGGLAVDDPATVDRAVAALELLVGDPSMPREATRSTAWSVGENARRAIAKLRAPAAPR